MVTAKQSMTVYVQNDRRQNEKLLGDPFKICSNQDSGAKMARRSQANMTVRTRMHH